LIKRTLKPDIAASTGEIASDEDFAGARLTMVLADDTYWPRNFILTTSRGRHFEPTPKSVTKSSDKSGFEYCYVLEEAQLR
jgi:hypothetical protein